MFRKNIIYTYIIFFICLLIILFTLNFFYKKYISNLNIDTRYKVSALQVYNLKKKSIKNSLDVVIGKMNNRYLIEKMNIEKDSVTFKNNKSKITFELIIRDDHQINAENIETELNKFYKDSVNKIIDKIEKNLYLININELEKEFELQSYNKLINSKFFKEYPPEKCNFDKLYCYKQYISYYGFIFNMISKNIEVKEILESFKSKTFSKKNNIEILEDLNNNQVFFMDEKIIQERNNFFLKKVEGLKETDFYNEFLFGTVDCAFNQIHCFTKINKKIDLILKQHKFESSNPYNVKLKKNNLTKTENYILNDGPLILGLTTIITYIFFILTNKFFRRKQK